MSTMTSKGQTTIPHDVRDLLGLGPRQRIVYQIEGNSVRIRPAGGSLMAVAGGLPSLTAAKNYTTTTVTYSSTSQNRI